MSLIERELQIHSPTSNSVDIQPRGQGCYTGLAVYGDDHKFYLTTEAAGFIYKICGVCGTGRIIERRF